MHEKGSRVRVPRNPVAVSVEPFQYATGFPSGKVEAAVKREPEDLPRRVIRPISARTERGRPGFCLSVPPLCHCPHRGFYCEYDKEHKMSRFSRSGYTTGSCAAAGCAAAAGLLLGGERAVSVLLRTPRGLTLEIPVAEVTRGESFARAVVVKDAGDDPDITHGMRVVSEVSRINAGFEIRGGEGVGVVTKPGLRCAVGEPAINPVPRAMILRELEAACARRGYLGGLRAVISIPRGRAAAERTMNPRLGVQGGLSILGTTGIVEPMSERAMVETVRLEIGQRRALGERALVLAPGNYGLDFAKRAFGLPEKKPVKCSNFIGEALDSAVAAGFRDILLIGHAGKLVKLAAGVFNTHSRVADTRMETLAAHCAGCGGSRELVAELMDCATVDAADALLLKRGMREEVWASVAERVFFHLQNRVGADVRVAFAAFCGTGAVMCSKNFRMLLSAAGDSGGTP